MAFSDLDQLGSLWLRSTFGLDGLLIFAFSETAFYALARRRFYFSRSFHHGRLDVHVPRRHVHPQLETVVHWASQVLLAAEGMQQRNFPPTRKSI
jgi:hypothetical protein